MAAIANLSGESVGPYRLIQQVGVDALGPVYHACRTETGEFFAIKQFRPEVVSTPGIREDLQAEVCKAASLRHDAIAVITGLLEDNGNVFLATEWVEGDNLEFFLLANGAMSPAAAAELMQPILRAVAHSHDLGISHGWLRAANVLVTPLGPKIINFGLKRCVESLHENHSEPFDACAFFMPPEWFSGDPLDHRSDVYMLGALLFQMLTGKQHPLVSGTGSANPPSIEELLLQFRRWLTPGMSAVMGGAMARDPRKRFPSVAEFESAFLAAIRDILEHRPQNFVPAQPDILPVPSPHPPAPPAQPVLPAPRRFGLSPRQKPLLTAALIVAAIATGYAVSARIHRVPPLPTTPAQPARVAEIPRSAVPARQQLPSFLKSRRIAVIAGIDSYTPAGGFSPLQFASRDAAELAEELEKNQGYTVHLFQNEKVARIDLRAALREAADRTNNSESTLLFFFAGHGGESRDHKHQYLATYGCAADNMAEFCMPLTEVEEILAGASAPRKMMFIDACRSNLEATGERGAPTINRYSQLEAAQGLRILNSTGADQISYEEPRLKHGVFTYFLLEGLRGRAADDDHLITFEGLTNYVRSRMSEPAPDHPHRQVPLLQRRKLGEFPHRHRPWAQTGRPPQMSHPGADWSRPPTSLHCRNTHVQTSGGQICPRSGNCE